jgi:hypothetical protein
LTVEGTLDVSSTLEDFTKLFEILVTVLFFNSVLPFLLGRCFLCAGTAKLNKFGAGSA